MMRKINRKESFSHIKIWFSQKRYIHRIKSPKLIFANSCVFFFIVKRKSKHSKREKHIAKEEQKPSKNAKNFPLLSSSSLFILKSIFSLDTTHLMLNHASKERMKFFIRQKKECWVVESKFKSSVIMWKTLTQMIKSSDEH